MTRCETCGAEYEVGDWPWCPHGAYGGTNITDTIVGGQMIENLGDQPVYVESKSQLAREAKARGLRWNVRHAPGPHGDKSKITTRWY
jgi:hypothetical protein